METTLGPGFTLEEPARIQRLNALYGELQRITAATDREKERYGAAAESPEEALCCAVDYDRQSLAHIPDRVLKVDYGCGDPTVYARRGMTVLDLGSGSGKHAFMIARAVGEGGQVIGIDKTPEMLALSRGAVDEVTQNLGLAAPTVEFRAGHIENLRVGLDRLHAWLGDHEIRGYDDLEALEAYLDAEPLVADESVDLVVSNCVLNLVADHRKEQLLRELFRVLRRSGSVAISDIVCDREIPQAMKDDAELWSGCLSGAWGRQDFLDAFARAGFHGMTEVKASFWKRVEGINFFSVTIRAWKGKQGAGYETHRSALYRGPFARVSDDDGHEFVRGRFTPVCDKTAELLSRVPYTAFFEVTPALEDPARKLPFACPPHEAAGRSLDEVQQGKLDAWYSSDDCCTDTGCC